MNMNIYTFSSGFVFSSNSVLEEELINSMMGKYDQLVYKIQIVT